MKDLKTAEFESSSSSAQLVSLNKQLPLKVFENLPEPLKKLTDKFENREKDIVFLSLIGVISACLPNVFGIYDSRINYPNLNVFIVAPPSSGKGVMNWSKKIIEPIRSSSLLLLE